MILAGLVIFILVFMALVLVIALLGGLTTQEQKLIVQRLEALGSTIRRGAGDEGVNLLREEMLSRIPTINRLLLRLDLFPALRRVLSQSGCEWTFAGVLLRSLGAAVAAALAVYWRTNVVIFSLLMGVAAAGLPIGYVFFKRWQRFSEFERLLPQALDMMVNALRAGHSLVSAIEIAAREIPDPVGTELKKTFDEQNFGLDLREAMLNLSQRVPLHDIRIVVTAILIQKEAGGNLAEILDKVAYIIRERFRIKRQVRVHTAQGRLTGWILTFLPPILAAGLYIVRPDHMSQLWRHEKGMRMIYAAVIMTIIGGLIIRKIVRIRV